MSALVRAQWRQAQRKTASGPYYHGTFLNFAPGTELVPAVEHGLGQNYQVGMGADDAVYLTTELDQAYFYAVLAAGARGLGAPVVFEVEPEGVVTSQAYPGQEVLAERATITRNVTDAAQAAFARERDRWEGTIRSILGDEDAERFTRFLSVREAASTSWRPVTPEGTVPWAESDAVVMTKTGPAHGRRQGFQVYTYGHYQGTFLSLAEAKGWVEMVYGPLPWRAVRIDPTTVEHYYWGETEEFSEPTTIYVCDTLPKLGRLA